MVVNDNGRLKERFTECYSTLFPVSVETVPTLHFYSNHKFLQVSTLGCNFSRTSCISEILAAGSESISATLKRVPPEKVVAKVKSENCAGIVFCVNDPTVSSFSFLKLARAAKAAGLLVGFRQPPLDTGTDAYCQHPLPGRSITSRSRPKAPTVRFTVWPGERPVRRSGLPAFCQPAAPFDRS